MKKVLGFLILGVAGFFAFQQMKPKPAPPPPPPPPPVIQEPAPLIDPEEQAKIIKSAGDQDSNVRWEALMLLDKMKSPQAYPVMFDHLAHDEDVDIRMKLIGILEDRRTPDVVKAITGTLKDMEGPIRARGLQALDKLGDFSVTPAIMDTLKDQDDTVRAQALRTLNSLQDKRQVELKAEQERQAAAARAAAAAAAEAAKKK